MGRLALSLLDQLGSGRQASFSNADQETLRHSDPSVENVYEGSNALLCAV